MATADNLKLYEVALRIREMREILELSVEDMAEKTGVTVAEYETYESGKYLNLYALLQAIEVLV